MCSYEISQEENAYGQGDDPEIIDEVSGLCCEARSFLT